MKIPLEHEPFAPVTLSRGQEEQLEWLSDALLEETLAENDEFVHRNNRVVDKTQWKQVMSRENIAIYKHTAKGEMVGGCTPDVDLSRSHLEPRSRYWRLPLCIGVGTLTGSLDDLLYGALAPTQEEYKARSTYTKDDLADTRVIATVVRPSESDPLRSMTVRWTLLYQLLHKMVVSPRDVVHLDSMGTRILPNGERIGYIIHQSVDLPECGELKELGLVRATYSACYVFRDTGHGSIEVYMRAHMDPGGKLRDGIAVFSACMALISIWRYIIAGQNKKLAFMARTSLASKSRPDVFEKAKQDTTASCALCFKSLSSFRSHARCDLCHTKMCSRCVDKRKLTHIQRDGGLVRVPTQICKTCISMAVKMNASDIAASEQLPGSNRSIRLYSSTTSSSSGGSQSRQSPHFAAWSNRDSSYLRQSSDTITSDSTARRSGMAAHSHASSAISLLDADFSLPSPSYWRDSARSIATANVDDEAEFAVDKTHFDLWAKMNQLRISTEEAYTMTMQNAAMAESSGRPGALPNDSISYTRAHKDVS